jgi:uncharacterized protein
MFTRNLASSLASWKKKPDRKPLILRGARQVGKSTLVRLFAPQFDQFIELNLDKGADKRLFRQFIDIHELVQAIFLQFNLTYTGKSTLLFIDEIQEEPAAIAQLRFFLEDYPDLYVIAAGSLLESLFNYSISFPVGRVEYLMVRPVSFEEYLEALEEKQALIAFRQIPVPDFAYSRLLKLFHQYTLIGGMPEVVQNYVVNRDLSLLGVVFESLLMSYLDDVEKYAQNHHLQQVIRHCIRAGFAEVGNRIHFQGFGNSNYKSKEVGESMRALEKAMLIHLMYPLTDTKLPMLPDLKRSPRLQLFDTGLLNYFAGIQKEIIGTDNLNEVYAGKVAEHIAGQEIRYTMSSSLHPLTFWVREKKTSSAEVDFVLPFEGQLIPVEVKSGSAGKLRSLHQYMEIAPHDIAVRLYAGPYRIDSTHTPSAKSFRLINIPYFHASLISSYLNKT